MIANERSGASECAAACFQVCVPKLPSMNHVRPDRQGHGNVSGAGNASKTHGIIEQRLVRSRLDQRRWESLQIRIEWRDTRILTVEPGGNVGIGQFIEIDLMDKWINGVLADQRRTGHR